MPTLTVNQRVAMIVDATIGGVACAGSVWEDQCAPSANVTTWKGATAPDAPPTKAEMDSGFAAVPAAVAAEFASVGVVPINEDGATLDDLLEELTDAVWDEATSGHVDAGSTGKALIDILEDTGTTLPAQIAVCASVVANSSDATAAGAITRRRGDSWSIALTLGAITDWTSLWFTIKNSYSDLDSAALLHVKLNATGLLDGLLYVNGVAATNDALASITVSNAATGAIIVAVDETVTDDLSPGTYYYDAQVLITGAVTTPDSGTFTVTADVTRSVT
jgi:hypothetical protein